MRSRISATRGGKASRSLDGAENISTGGGGVVRRGVWAMA
jgi:hypothetical protein